MARVDRGNKRLDGRDTESLEILLRSHGWQLVEQRINRELEKQQADLERPHSEGETAAIRGKIEMLRLTLRLPQQLRTESMKGRTKPDE